MKTFRCTVAGFLLFWTGLLMAQTVSQTAQGVRLKVPGENFSCEVQFYTPSIVRVVKYPQAMPETKSLAVILAPQDTKVKTHESADAVTLKSSEITVTLDKRTGALSFADKEGNALLKEQGAPLFQLIESGVDKGDYRVRQAFRLDADEAVYGLGQLQNGKMSQRNQRKYMIQGNVEDFSPFIQSVKGYGLYWDNYSPTTFADNAEETSFESEVGECIDYYFMYGGNADGVVAEVRTLTGEVPMFPLWTYGFWQSKERYKSQDETVGVVRKYRELGVPLDGIIQDWQYWGHNYLWNAMDFTNPLFPDPQKMLDDIHGMNAHMAISIWSSFGPATKPYRELAPKGLLFDFKTWPESGRAEVWPPDLNYPSGVRPYNPYSAEARDIYWKYLNEGIFKYGMDAWWMDSTEPDHLQFKPSDLDAETGMGSFRKVRNAYPLMTVGGVYDHQRALTSDKRVFILTRSGYIGQQRYGSNVWSGDVGSSWESLRNQVPAGLNFSLCGMPHWNNDIGGFFAGQYNKSWNDGSAPKNPLYQELYVRWMQFGTFTPMMRSHGADTPREIYQFGQKGEPIYDAIEKMIRLRYTLLPYIYSTSWQVTHNQYTFMRALAMDFPQDKKGWDMNDEYMFGPAILVAPVLEAQYTPEQVVKVDEQSGWNRENAGKAEQGAAVDFTQKKSAKVYLPAGASWYDYWTGERLEGGQEITRETTIDLVPLYIKAGSIIPTGPDVQYATEKAWDNLVINVYPGANGEFCLYEDEFDNYNYEKGAYTEITLKWNDAKRTLTIGARKGSYTGMLEKRKFTVRTPDGKQKVVNYTGKKVTVKM